jgi:hypothetical protein
VNALRLTRRMSTGLLHEFRLDAAATATATTAHVVIYHEHQRGEEACARYHGHPTCTENL